MTGELSAISGALDAPKKTNMAREERSSDAEVLSFALKHLKTMAKAYDGCSPCCSGALDSVLEEIEEYGGRKVVRQEIEKIA